MALSYAKLGGDERERRRHKTVWRLSSDYSIKMETKWGGPLNGPCL
jgi:hypothetical protein